MVINKIKINIDSATPDNGINSEDKISPQNIKDRFNILSAKNPNIGCKSDEKICETVKMIVAIAIEIPIFAAINGIIGFSIPVYTSFTKCAPQSQNSALLFWGKVVFIKKLKFKQDKKSIRRF